MSMKTCRTCGEHKHISEYPVQRKGGFRGSDTPTLRLDCKRCTAEAAREYRKTYVGKPGKVTKYPEELRYLVSAIRMRLTDAKQRAANAGTPFNLTTDFLLQLWDAQEGRCAVSKLPLSLEKGTPHVLSLDQVKAGLGYVEGNVQWLSWAVNRAKGDLTMPEFLGMCSAVVEGATTIPQGSTLKRVEAPSTAML